MKNKFHGTMGKQIVKHLKLRRALGRDYRANESTLLKFNQFVSARWPRALALSREMVFGYLKTNTHLKAISRRNEITYLRMFAVDLAAEGIATYIPERRLLPKDNKPVRVHIFSEAEIKSIMQLASNLSGSAKVMYPTLIGIYWVTGLRLNEAVSLNIGDIDFDERTILVRRGKFGKSRLIPISVSTAEALRAHIVNLKKLNFSTALESPLFLSNRRVRLCKGVVAWMLKRLYVRAGIKTSCGKYPRNHDLRHSFATHALKAVRQRGEDPSNAVPALALVMGHTHIAHTQTYLHPSMETLQVASKAFEKKLLKFGRAS